MAHVRNNRYEYLSVFFVSRKRKVLLCGIILGGAVIIFQLFVVSMTAAATFVYPTDTFDVLCTTTHEKEKWGSYQIRCQHLAQFMKLYGPSNVRILPLSLKDVRKRAFNATIVVKSPLNHWSGRKNPKLHRRQVGQVFVDVVDNYRIEPDDIPESDFVLAQGPGQAEVFRDHHRTWIVTHWYNTFPTDTVYVPLEVRPLLGSALNVATVWDMKHPSCRIIDVANVSYDCIEEGFDIQEWYHKYRNDVDEDTMKQILRDPGLGPGFLYYKLFRGYDLLIVYVKDPQKQDMGNAQRAVSQMRSGVPVLLETVGRVHVDFARHYGYNCTFHSDETLVAALEELKSVERRRECQQHGLSIANDFSPQAIIQDYLTALGISNEDTGLRQNRSLTDQAAP